MPRVRRNLNGRRKERSEGARKLRIRQLDPTEMCGRGTSVTALYRVEETLGDIRIHHLVFFDRHGWYCEHGKQCGVVKDVQQFVRSRT